MIEPNYANELAECYSDPIYFIEKYCLLERPDGKQIQYGLHDYNKNVIRSYKRDNKVIVKSSRQMGKTLTMICHIVWSILFKSDQKVMIISTKFDHSSYMLRSIQEIYNRLPKWMQANIIYCNRNEFALTNGSKVLVQAATLNACKGISDITMLCVDEMDFIDPIIQNYIMEGIAPFAKQVILLSTKNPRNDTLSYHVQTFERVVEAAANGDNGFTLHLLNWDQHPDRDINFKQHMISTIGLNYWNSEYELKCS